MGRHKSMPVWLDFLIFIVPLIWSEYMFLVASRFVSAVLFPIAWIAFWITIQKRGE